MNRPPIMQYKHVFMIFLSLMGYLPCLVVHAFSRNCTITDSVGKKLVDLEIKILCNTNDDRMLECINQDPENVGPALLVDPVACGPLDVTITFKVCNNGPADFIVNDSRSRILYNAEKVDIAIGDGKSIESARCRVHQIQRTYDTCDRQRAMSIQVQGRSEVEGRPVYGYCYLHRRATIQYTEKILGPCTSNNFLFTEMAFPNDRPVDGKYIEIFNPDCAGGIIADDFKIVKYPGDLNSAPRSFSLKNIQMRNDGFLVICNEPTEKSYRSNDMCDIIDDYIGPTMPHDAFSIIASDGTVLDTYGYPSDTQDHDPVQRAVRHRIGASASPNWNPNDWTTKDLANTWDMDPRRWKFDD